jgi:hypothetical protein
MYSRPLSCAARSPSPRAAQPARTEVRTGSEIVTLDTSNSRDSQLLNETTQVIWARERRIASWCRHYYQASDNLFTSAICSDLYDGNRTAATSDFEQ